MTVERPFTFDFNEDAEPVAELHRLRMATMRHFKTLEAVVEYHNSCPPVEEIRARLKKEIAEKNAKEAKARASGTAKKAPKKTAAGASGKAPARRKPAKRLTPA